MLFDNLLYSVENGVAHVVLNRPEKRNAIDQTMVNELHDALDGFVADGDVHACIFHGAGEKAFIGGADIAQLRDRKAADALKKINSALFAKIEGLPFPTIAAIHGFCLGGGCELAMSCDLRVAAEGSRFGLPEVTLGIIPGAGGTQRLPRLVGLGRAKELILTGRIIDAQEAHEIGLVNRLVPGDELMAAAQTLAGEILANGALAVRLAKLNLNNAVSAGLDTALLLEQVSQAVLFESEEKHARMTAFLERRKK